MRNSREDPEDQEKMLVQEYLRNRIRNTLPEEVRRKELREAFRTPPPQDYLAQKHTFASMKKIANHKSRKIFIFDGYDQQKKRQEASQVLRIKERLTRSMPQLADALKI